MTDTDRKAHDIAVALATCAEQTKQNAIIAANIKMQNEHIDINIEPDSFIEVYKVTYAKALTALES